MAKDRGTRHWRERMVGTVAHDLAGIWMLVWSYLPAVGAIWLFHLRPSALTLLFAMIVVGVRMNALFVVVHESWHFNLVRSRKLNEWLGGALACYPIVMPYFQDRNTHWNHHRHVGTHQDPDAWAWDWPDERPEAFWRALLHVASGLSYAQRIVRILLGRPAPPPPPGRPPRPQLEGAAVRGEVLRLAVVHLVILGIFWTTIGAVWYFPLWLFPGLAIFPAWVMLREFLEHRNGALIVYRSNPIERFLLGCFNFHLHAYHHAFASAPWFTLPVMRERAHARVPEIVYLPSYFGELLAFARGRSTVKNPRAAAAGEREELPAGSTALGERGVGEIGGQEA